MCTLLLLVCLIECDTHQRAAKDVRVLDPASAGKRRPVRSSGPTLKRSAASTSLIDQHIRRQAGSVPPHGGARSAAAKAVPDVPLFEGPATVLAGFPGARRGLPAGWTGARRDRHGARRGARLAVSGDPGAARFVPSVARRRRSVPPAGGGAGGDGICCATAAFGSAARIA